jgi:hypothetical protein
MDSSSDDELRVVYFQKNGTCDPAVPMASAHALEREVPVELVRADSPENTHDLAVEPDFLTTKGKTSANETKSFVSLFQSGNGKLFDKKSAGTRKHRCPKPGGQKRPAKAQTARLLLSMQAGARSDKSSRGFTTTSSLIASCTARPRADECQGQSATTLVAPNEGEPKSNLPFMAKHAKLDACLSPCLSYESNEWPKGPPEELAHAVQADRPSKRLLKSSLAMQPGIQPSTFQQACTSLYTNLQHADELAASPRNVTPPPKPPNSLSSFLAAQKPTAKRNVPSSASLAHVATILGPMVSPPSISVLQRPYKRHLSRSAKLPNMHGHGVSWRSAHADDEIDEVITTPMLSGVSAVFPVGASSNLPQDAANCEVRPTCIDPEVAHQDD